MPSPATPRAASLSKPAPGRARHGCWCRASCARCWPASRPGFKPFLPGAGVRWAGNEVALAWRGQVVRIDRLVQREGERGPEWWVLDYKIGHTPQGPEVYREQLARYREAVQAGEPDARVRAAFVTGLGEVVELA